MDKKKVVAILAVLGALATAIGSYFGLDIKITAKEIAAPVPAVEAPVTPAE